MDPLHQESYDALYEGARTLYQQHLLSPANVDIGCVLVKILRLRQSCNHIDACLEREEFKNPEMRHSEMSSSKIDKIMEILGNVPQGEKTIIFSQWSQTLQILTYHLQEANVEYFQYNGSMSISQKNSVLEQFRKTPTSAVLLMTLQSGSLGLNLSDCSNNVILIDSWFNKALEEQAIDRVYRIGQTKEVRVDRLVVVSSIESWLLAMKNEKSLVDSQFHKEGLVYTINHGLLSSILGQYI